jgi:hypothetical protein
VPETNAPGDQYDRPLVVLQNEPQNPYLVGCGNRRRRERDLAPGKKKETLEATSGNGVKFPVIPTLLPYLPGMEQDAKAEFSNFKFMQFADQRGPGSRRPMANMPDMRGLFTQAILISNLWGETIV